MNVLNKEIIMEFFAVKEETQIMPTVDELSLMVIEDKFSDDVGFALRRLLNKYARAKAGYAEVEPHYRAVQDYFLCQ